MKCLSVSFLSSFFVVLQICSAYANAKENISVDVIGSGQNVEQDYSSEVMCQGNEKNISVSITNDIKHNAEQSTIEKLEGHLGLSIKAELGLATAEAKTKIFNELLKKSNKSHLKSITVNTKQEMKIEPYQCFIQIGEIEYDRLTLGVSIPGDGWFSNDPSRIILHGNTKYQTRIKARFDWDQCRGCGNYDDYDKVIGEGGEPVWAEIDHGNKVTFLVPLIWAKNGKGIIDPHEFLPEHVQADLAVVSLSVQPGAGPASNGSAFQLFKANGNNIRIREAPNTDSQILDTIHSNSDPLEVVGTRNGEKIDGDENWHIVRLQDGKLGFVAASLLVPSQ